MRLHAAGSSWSQLLQSFTGEAVEWKGRKGPNKRQLAKKALQGITQQWKKEQKKGSKESVSFAEVDVLELQPRQSVSLSLLFLLFNLFNGLFSIHDIVGAASSHMPLQ